MMKIFIDASLIVYLNTPSSDFDARVVDFYKSLLKEELYTDVLALDEAIYVSKKKYGIAYEDTFELLENGVLPHVDVLPVGELEFFKAKVYMLKHGLKPSDALHLAVIENHGLQAIATEDRHFDGIIKRIWL